jgi:predicted GNAT superfamily acetyltransferase
MYNNMALDDKNKKTASQTETNTTILNLTYSLGFIPEKLNITASLNSTKLKNNLYQNTMTGVTAGINKMLASDKITLSWNNSFMLNKVNADNGTVINTTFTAGLHISKKQSINLSVYYTSNKFANSSTTPSYNEYRGDFSYVYTF